MRQIQGESELRPGPTAVRISGPETVAIVTIVFDLPWPDWVPPVWRRSEVLLALIALLALWALYRLFIRLVNKRAATLVLAGTGATAERTHGRAAGTVVSSADAVHAAERKVPKHDKRQAKKQAEVFIAAGRVIEAAGVYEDLQEYKRAARLYEESLSWSLAAKCHVRLENWRAVAFCRLMENNDRGAIDALNMLNDNAAAAEFLDEHQQYYYAARYYEAVGKDALALSCYLQVTSADGRLRSAMRRAVILGFRLGTLGPTVARLNVLTEGQPLNEANLLFFRLYAHALLGAEKFDLAAQVFRSLVKAELMALDDVPQPCRLHSATETPLRPEHPAPFHVNGQLSSEQPTRVEMLAKQAPVASAEVPAPPARAMIRQAPREQPEQPEPVPRDSASIDSEIPDEPVSSLADTSPSLDFSHFKSTGGAPAMDATQKTPAAEKADRRSSLPAFAKRESQVEDSVPPVGREDEPATAQSLAREASDIPITRTLLPFDLGAADRYDVGHLLGSGGIGEVFLAKDKLLKRDVVLKFLQQQFAADAMVARYFFREARVSASLSHPNIVTVFDVGVISRRPFIAMEYLQGHALDQHLQAVGGMMDPVSSTPIVVQLCEALAYAHRHNVVHRDIKPENIMLVDSNVKLMDFGLAKVLSAASTDSLLCGTPQFMAPELITGKFLDHRIDIYALGITLYEIFTGELPFDGDNVLNDHLRRRPDDPRRKNPVISKAISRVILKCLSKDPDYRYSTATEVKTAYLEAIN